MKYFIIVVILFSVGCKSNVQPTFKKVDSVHIFIDTVNKATKKYDSLLALRCDGVDSLTHINDSLRKRLKLQKDELFAVKYTVGRLQYRIKICERNPKLKVFFYGWAKRIVAE